MLSVPSGIAAVRNSASAIRGKGHVFEYDNKKRNPTRRGTKRLLMFHRGSELGKLYLGLQSASLVLGLQLRVGNVSHAKSNVRS